MFRMSDDRSETYEIETLGSTASALGCNIIAVYNSVHCIPKEQSALSIVERHAIPIKSVEGRTLLAPVAALAPSTVAATCMATLALIPLSNGSHGLRAAVRPC